MSKPSSRTPKPEPQRSVDTLTTTPQSLEQLLDEIDALALRPQTGATAMPPGVYHNHDWHDHELQNIFYQDWLCAGLSAEIAAPGDYLTWQIGNQPVIVMRQRDGTLKAFSNVCRHRMMQLLDGRGHCASRRITCPYHAWSYHLDGALAGAPHMDKRPNFDKSHYGLNEIRLELWEGWIYLTLNPDATQVATLLKNLQPLVANFAMDGYVPVAQQDHRWNTNWKMLTENFMEGYHLPVAHKNTVGAHLAINETRFSTEAADPSFTYQYFIKTDGAPLGTAHANNKRLKGKERNTSIMPTIFPTHMYVLAPDHLWYLSLQPDGTDYVKIRFGLAIAPEVLAASEDADALIANAVTFLDAVNAEDKSVVEGIFHGSRAPMSEPGPLSWLEQENHEFTQYVARSMRR